MVGDQQDRTRSYEIVCIVCKAVSCCIVHRYTEKNRSGEWSREKRTGSGALGVTRVEEASRCGMPGSHPHPGESYCTWCVDTGVYKLY
eukprot:4319978-Prymnesium_polylepis.1